MTMEEIFELLVKGRGKAYLDADEKLRAGGKEAEDVLNAHIHDTDPIARLAARTTLDWLIPAKAKDYQSALDYLKALPEIEAKLITGTPSPTGTSAYLSLHYKDRLVDLLALRLVKGTDWAPWLVGAVTSYLEEQKRPSATAALLRFAVETREPEYVEWAVDAIRAANDPDLVTKLADEKARCQKLGLRFPGDLAALDKKKP